MTTKSDVMQNLEQRIAMKVAGEDVVALEEKGVLTKKISTFRLTAGELRKACEECEDKDHPSKSVFLKACNGLTSDYIIVVELPDLQAMLTGKYVEMHTERVPGKDPIITKRLVDEKPVVATTIPPALEMSVDPASDMATTTPTKSEGSLATDSPHPTDTVVVSEAGNDTTVGGAGTTGTKSETSAKSKARKKPPTINDD